MTTPGHEMSLLDHLGELRRTLLWAMGLAAVATVAAWFLSDAIVDILLRPAVTAGGQPLYFNAPMEAFLLKLKASAVVGLFLVLPLILHRIYGFVMPGLYENERKVVTPLLLAATALFYAGVAFCFFILVPLVIRFAVGFATDSLQPLLTAGAYFGMVARLCLAFGLVFELPMVIFALSWAGVVDPAWLLRGWRYALIVILVVAAVLTPPDIISQALLAGPVMVLYLGSVLISLAVKKRRKAADEAEEPDTGDSDDPGESGPRN